MNDSNTSDRSAWYRQVHLADFEESVLAESHHRLVVLDISAEWCGPCRVLEPVILRVGEAYAGKFLLAKLEAEDEDMKVAGRYGARGFPTVIAFRNGEEVDRFHGAQMESFVRDFVERNF